MLSLSGGTLGQTFLNGRNTKGDVYAYDKAYRMIDARYDVTNPASEVTTPGSQAYVKLIQYTLDGVGNRSQVQTTPPTPPSTVTYASDVMNQYTTLGGALRVHDNNGNLTDDATNTYVYDYKNRLVEVKLKSTGASIATYKYDALGRRVEKALNAGGATRYVLCRQQVIEEYDATDTWQAAYIQEAGIDHPRAMDRADVSDVNGNSNTTEVLRFHYHQNALSSSSELTQLSGAVVEWLTYDVYGKATIRDKGGTVVTQSAVGNPYLYTGREYDPESGMYFYRARTYDPVAGRFLQRDPLGYVDGLGLYEYVSSTPMRYSDPLGTARSESTLTLHGGSGDKGRARLSTLTDAVKKVAAVAGLVAEVTKGKHGTNSATVTFEKTTDSGYETSPEAKKLLEHIAKIAAKYGAIDVSMVDRPTTQASWGSSTWGMSTWGASYGCNNVEMNPNRKGAWRRAWDLLHELFHIGVYHDEYDSQYLTYLIYNAGNPDKPTRQEASDAAAYAAKKAREATQHHDGGEPDPDGKPGREDKVFGLVREVRKRVGSKNYNAGPAKKVRKGTKKTGAKKK